MRTRIFNDSGRIPVVISDEIIDAAKQRSSSACGIAEALKKLDGVRYVSVDLATIRFSRHSNRYCCLTPKAAQQFIVDFDRGDDVRGFEMHLKPSWIVRSGKKRRAPYNDELKASGLDIRVAKEQLHLRSKRYLNGQRNVSPDRQDGLARPLPVPPAPPDPQKRNKARALISTASSRDSVRTVLGGRLPPTGAGSTRSYGLRALRA